MYESSIQSLPLVGRGKVRDIYAVGDDKLLIVTTDRLSAYDVILPTPIPEKGHVLTELANFWFDKLASIVPNHLTGIDPETVVAPERARAGARALHRRAAHEARSRSRRWCADTSRARAGRNTRSRGSVCGIKLPPGLKRASKLPHPIFTPATKAEAGHHDENISFEQMASAIGEARAREVRDTAITLYEAAAKYALERGIIIADTKFEFGTDDDRQAPSHRRGAHAGLVALLAARHVARRREPESFDKQYVRNWLDSIGFERKPPAPPMPDEVAREDEREIPGSAEAPGGPMTRAPRSSRPHARAARVQHDQSAGHGARVRAAPRQASGGRGLSRRVPRVRRGTHQPHRADRRRRRASRRICFTGHIDIVPLGAAALAPRRVRRRDRRRQALRTRLDRHEERHRGLRVRGDRAGAEARAHAGPRARHHRGRGDRLRGREVPRRPEAPRARRRHRRRRAHRQLSLHRPQGPRVVRDRDRRASPPTARCRRWATTRS